ncbi:MAG: TraB/GumN family protein [Burkholderiales bacterium]
MLFKRFFFGIVVLLLAASPAFSASSEPFAQGLLWKISKAGVKPSYAFGTIHLDDARVTNLPAPVKRAFAGSASFTMEMIIDEDSTQKFLGAMLLPESDLQTLLGEPLFTDTAGLLAEYGMPQEVITTFKPWAVMLTLMLPQRQGIIVDSVLHELALRQKKNVYQLENVDEQIAVFDGLPLEVQIGLLRQTVTHHDLIPDMVEESLHAYLKRDLAAMWDINNRIIENDAVQSFNDAFIERVLYQRNARMVERMQPRLQEGNAFFAMGALHLYGKKGVLSLLKARGYSITRVY